MKISVTQCPLMNKGCTQKTACCDCEPFRALLPDGAPCHDDGDCMPRRLPIMRIYFARFTKTGSVPDDLVIGSAADE